MVGEVREGSAKPSKQSDGVRRGTSGLGEWMAGGRGNRARHALLVVAEFRVRRRAQRILQEGAGRECSEDAGGQCAGLGRILDVSVAIAWWTVLAGCDRRRSRRVPDLAQAGSARTIGVRRDLGWRGCHGQQVLLVGT
jgi:hypothetical protein